MGHGELWPSLHVCIPMPVAEGNADWWKDHQGREKGRNAHWGKKGKAPRTEHKDSADRPPGCPFLPSDLESTPLPALNLILCILDRKPSRPWWPHSDTFTLQEVPYIPFHFIDPTSYVDFSISMLLRIIVTSPYSCHSNGKSLAFSKQDRVTAGRYNVAFHQVTSHVLVIPSPPQMPSFPTHWLKATSSWASLGKEAEV